MVLGDTLFYLFLACAVVYSASHVDKSIQCPHQDTPSKSPLVTGLLAPNMVRQRVVFKIATLVYQSLSDPAPGYLADDCQLVTDARAFCWHEDTDCPPNLQLLWGQDLCSCGHKSLEQVASWLTTGWIVILPVQTVAEDVFIPTVRPRHFVNLFSLFRVEIFVLTYLCMGRLRRTGGAVWLADLK